MLQHPKKVTAQETFIINAMRGKKKEMAGGTRRGGRRKKNSSDNRPGCGTSSLPQ